MEGSESKMTHRCLLANSGNVLERLLVALFGLLSFLCRNQIKYSEERYVYFYI